MDSATKEIPAYMGTREEARAKLLEAARLYRETMQPAFLTASEIKKKDAITHERRSRLANAALLWVWFEEEQPALPSGSLREALARGKSARDRIICALHEFSPEGGIEEGTDLGKYADAILASLTSDGVLAVDRAVLRSTVSGGDRG